MAAGEGVRFADGGAPATPGSFSEAGKSGVFRGASTRSSVGPPPSAVTVPSGSKGSVLGSAEYLLSEAAAESRAFRQPHVHILGEILGGRGFPDGVTCRFAIEAGGVGDKAWERSEGEDTGQTQVAYAPEGAATAPSDELEADWCHPLDVHFLAGSLRGWPRMMLEVWQLDPAGRMDLCGYGYVAVPSTPGSHTVDVPTWRPVGTPAQEIAALFLGGAPRLARTSYLYTRRTERHELVTVGSGTVRIRFDIVTRNFSTHGVEFS